MRLSQPSLGSSNALLRKTTTPLEEFLKGNNVSSLQEFQHVLGWLGFDVGQGAAQVRYHGRVSEPTALA
jgi:hypothetical protein